MKDLVTAISHAHGPDPPSRPQPPHHYHQQIKASITSTKGASLAFETSPSPILPHLRSLKGMSCSPSKLKMLSG